MQSFACLIFHVQTLSYQYFEWVHEQQCFNVVSKWHSQKGMHKSKLKLCLKE